MSNNPYQPPTPSDGQAKSRLPVFRHAFTGIAAVVAGTVTMVPGLVLLNQKLQVFPTNSTTSSIDINGRPISNDSMIWWSLSIGISLILLASFLITRAIWNWRPRNKQTVA